MERRFKNFGEEYEWYLKADPHYMDVQKTLAEELIASIPPNSSKTVEVLEIGCGTGLTLSEILQIAPKNVLMYALDNESDMLEKAIDNNRDESIIWIHSDALEYVSKRENKFHAIVSAYTLHNMLKGYRKELYGAIHKALKPNGVFINADRIPRGHDDQIMKDLNWEINQYANIFIPAGKPDLARQWIDHVFTDAQEDRIQREGQYISDMEELGFLKPKELFRERMLSVYATQKLYRQLTTTSSVRS